MFEALYPIAAMALISVSAIAGALISFFTKLEMETYKKQIGLFQILAGAALLVFVAVISFKAVYLVALAAGLVLGRISARKESSWATWAFLGAFAGSLFAYNANLGFLAAAFMVIFAFLKATSLNIPLILKKKKFLKLRLFEQDLFLAFAATFYFVMRVAAGYAGAAVVYLTMGALVWMLWKEAVTSYF